MLHEGETLLEGERAHVRHVMKNLHDEKALEDYAKWLQPFDVARSAFVQSMADAISTFNPDVVPALGDFNHEWAESIGHHLVRCLLQRNNPQLWREYVRACRPALRAVRSSETVPVGGSKLGGFPDLPVDVQWPLAKESRVHCIQPVTSSAPMTFLLQVRLEEVRESFVAEALPANEGLLSFFGFNETDDLDHEGDGARGFFFPSTARLATRRSQPPPVAEANGIAPEHRLSFEETLDVPASYYGVWSEQFPMFKDEYPDEARPDGELLFGYGVPTTGADPSPTLTTVNIGVLPTACSWHEMHLQMEAEDLKAARMENLLLSWIDYDVG